MSYMRTWDGITRKKFDSSSGMLKKYTQCVLVCEERGKYRNDLLCVQVSAKQNLLCSYFNIKEIILWSREGGCSGCRLGIAYPVLLWTPQNPPLNAVYFSWCIHWVRVAKAVFPHSYISHEGFFGHTKPVKISKWVWFKERKSPILCMNAQKDIPKQTMGLLPETCGWNCSLSKNRLFMFFKSLRKCPKGGKNFMWTHKENKRKSGNRRNKTD